MGVAARHRKHKHKMIFPSLLLALVTAAQAGNIAEELTKAGATTLVGLVVKAGLAETLSTSGPFTVFAPDNDAFARLGDSVLETLGSEVELLKKVLLYHVVSGNIYSSDATNNAKLDSVQGAPILVNLYLKSNYYDGFITINGKKVMKADMKADNGVIHCVSEVLFPIPEQDLVDTLVADDRFSTLVAAVTAAGLVDTIKNAGSLTIFAPTNDAFSKVPADLLDALLADPEALKAILLRHALPGSLFAKGITWQEHEWWRRTSLPLTESFMLSTLSSKFCTLMLHCNTFRSHSDSSSNYL